MLRTSVFLLFCLPMLLAQSLKAQDFETIDQSLVWMGAKATAKFESGWEASVKVDERRYWFPDRRQQRVLPDVNVAKVLAPKWKASAGVFVFNIYNPQTPSLEVMHTQEEIRPYATLSYGHGNWRYRLNAEYRLLEDAEGEYDNRTVRPRLMVQYVSDLGSRFDLSLGEELFVNIAGNRGADFFDQNRLTADLKTMLTDNLSLSTGYLHWFQPTGAENTYFSRHIATIGVNYVIDFRE